MAKRPLPTPDELRQLLRYEPETGKLFWRERGLEWFFRTKPDHLARVCASWNAAWAGKEAGVVSITGYRVVTILAAHIPAHRIAWCIERGEWPTGQIDHVNGQRHDNRIENLRDISAGENQRNMRRSRANTSGVTGVHWCKMTKRWRAEVALRSGRVRLGRFDTIEAAAEAVRNKREELGFSPRHGQDGPDFDAWRAINR